MNRAKLVCCIKSLKHVFLEEEREQIEKGKEGRKKKIKD
jgi:hypothetical protein